MAVAILPYLTDAEITKEYGYPSISASPSASSATSSALLLRSQQDKMPPPGFFGVLIQSLHPEACLKACYGVEDGFELEMPLEPIMTEIIDCIETENHEERLAGLEALHILVDKNHTNNRIPVVASRKWAIIDRLAYCLSIAADSVERRQICLILNNLSIPFDNKALMVLGDAGDKLLAALLKTINAKHPEAYLCCVCLMNLSILEKSKRTLMYYVPPLTATDVCENQGAPESSVSSTYNSHGDPLKNPSSLLRTLEQMIVIYSALLPSPVKSVEGQAVKWSMGFFRNLSTTVEHAKLLAQTAIPSVAGHLIRTSPRPLCKWTRDSFEDITLSFLVQLVQFPEVVDILNELHKELSTCLSEVAERKGIHGVRAALIFSLLHKTVKGPLAIISEH